MMKHIIILIVLLTISFHAY
ncbi:type I toxin-antitoxin system Ibs family toxin [Phytobacter diazotrophicus]